MASSSVAAAAAEDAPIPVSNNITTTTDRKPSASYQSFQDNHRSPYEPVGPHPPPAAEAKTRRDADGSRRRPWLELVALQAFSKPASIHHALSRIKLNVPYFRRNYAVAALVVVALALLWHPISLLVLALLVAVWIYAYFSRSSSSSSDGRAAIYYFELDRPIDERIVLAALTVGTAALLALTPGATSAILLAALLVAAAATLAHASFHDPDLVAGGQSRALLGSPHGIVGSSDWPVPQV